MAKFKDSAWLTSFLSAGEFCFEWDTGNSTKNERKHAVLVNEIEETFNLLPLIPIGEQTSPTSNEARFALMGKTKRNRKLFVVFTMRARIIRVISARPLSRSERRFYEKVEQEIFKN